MLISEDQEYISGGYLHAFTSREKAKGYTQLHSYCQNTVNRYVGQCRGNAAAVQEIFEEYVVRRMLIPKGTMYYEGADDDICAERLYWPEEETADPNQIKE